MALAFILHNLIMLMEVGEMYTAMAMEAGADVVTMGILGDGMVIIQITMVVFMALVGIMVIIMAIIMVGVMVIEQALGLLTMDTIMLLLLQMQQVMFILEDVEVLTL